MVGKRTFIVWAPYSRRSESLARAICADVRMIHYLKFKRPLYAPIKYVAQSVQTWRLLLHDHPNVVLIANPPLTAVFVVYLFKIIWGRGSEFIIDSHTGSFFDPRWKWSLPLHKYLSQRALTTLVTNEYLASIVRGWGAHVMVLEDPIPIFPAPHEPLDERPASLVVVNTFSRDEPVAELLQAAKIAPEINFYITGNHRLAKRHHLAETPSNVTFTGFLDNKQYLGLLRSVKGVVVLCTEDHTLLSGAYEAVACEQPMILSDWPILRNYFRRGAVYVKNNPEAIAAGARQLLTFQKQLRDEVKLLRDELDAEWAKKLVDLERRLTLRSLQA